MLGKLKLILMALIIPLLVPIQVLATTTSVSPNYSVDQVFFGVGGEQGGVRPSSTNYQAHVAVGETGVGNFSSTNYQAYSGFNTTSDPYIQIVVTAQNLDLGTLNTGTTAIATGKFFVRAWNSHGYVVQTDSPPPTNSGYTLHTPTTPTASATNTEQFGMNLVADTTPAALTSASPPSANPVQTTTYCCTIAYGAAYGNYATTNMYTYNNGDIIANSTKSTSSTIYTISYIFNINGSTPGGQYVFNQSIVATGTY